MDRLKILKEMISDSERNGEYFTDEIVGRVVSELWQRSEQGIKKYKTTLKDNNKDDFLQHLKEELMDAICYIEKIQHDIKEK